jgi:hypothetical protein
MLLLVVAAIIAGVAKVTRRINGGQRCSRFSITGPADEVMHLGESLCTLPEILLLMEYYSDIDPEELE